MKNYKQHKAIIKETNSNIIIAESVTNDKIEQKYHYSRYLDENDANKIIHEVIDQSEVDVTSLQLHDTLCPILWDDDELKPEIRLSLLKITKRFIEFSSLTECVFSDIIVTGSLANYNYTDNSDIDLHVVLDFSQISENIEFVEELLKLKKSIWNDNLPIQVKGFVVEVYYQDINEVLHASGTYSLMKNEWLLKPIKKIVNINTNNIKLKTAELMNAIDALENNNEKANWISSYDKLKDKIKKYRQNGLDREGEFSTENLVFKVLRNTGYLSKLADMKNNYLKNELTLKEFNDDLQ